MLGQFSRPYSINVSVSHLINACLVIFLMEMNAKAMLNVWSWERKGLKHCEVHERSLWQMYTSLERIHFSSSLFCQYWCFLLGFLLCKEVLTLWGVKLGQDKFDLPTCTHAHTHIHTCGCIKASAVRSGSGICLICQLGCLQALWRKQISSVGEDKQYQGCRGFQHGLQHYSLSLFFSRVYLYTVLSLVVVVAVHFPVSLLIWGSVQLCVLYSKEQG